MENLILQVFAVGQKYPVQMKEGCLVNFLLPAANTLRIGLSNISQSELDAFKSGGKTKCGFIFDPPLILWLFDFGVGGKYDAPFNAAAYQPDDLVLPEIRQGHDRLAVDMHIVELTDNTLKFLRVFTLPPPLTCDFIDAVKNQIKNFDSELFNKKLANIYKHPIDFLISKTKMYTGGT